MSDPQQLDLFDPPLTVIQNVCGRGLGPCKVIVEHDRLYCPVCGCVAPVSVTVTESPPTIFDGYIASQLRQLEFRRQSDSPPDDSGTTGPKDPAL